MNGIEVSTRPKYGTRKYKKDYDAIVNEKLITGEIQNTPKIVSVSIDYITPDSIIGNKSTSFKNEDYSTTNFNPKLMIYESINERKYSFDNLLNLINNSYNSNVKLVLHFSWPYLRGLDHFLEAIENRDNIGILHLGKRFCLEKNANFERPPLDIIHLSLEGYFWDLYYSKDTSIDFKVLSPTINRNDKGLFITDIINCDWSFDSRIKEIRERVSNEKLNRVEKNTVMFPPIIDSFLLPSETKKRCLKNGSWMTIPINETFETKTIENSYSIGIFNGLCSDIEKCKDIAYEFQNLFTTVNISKKTLFQSYLVEKMNEFYRITQSKNDNISQATICVANLHPYLLTFSSFAESINYLVNSTKIASKLKHFPKLTHKENETYIELKTADGEYCSLTIFKNGVLQKKNIREISKEVCKKDPNIEFNYFIDENNLQITIKKKSFVEYLELEKKQGIVNKNLFKGSIIYEAIIRSDGSFEENKFNNILFERKSNYFLISTEIDHRTEREYFKNKHEIRIFYGSLLQMQDLDKELIKNSELLIPGPIPFNTITDQEIVISQGYDALLLPFRKIVFFAYPGANLAQLLKQLDLYNGLISDHPTSVSTKDLLFSLKHTNKSKRFTLPSKPRLDASEEKKLLNDTPLDTTIRQEIMDDFGNETNEVEYIKTLKDIWGTIGQNNTFKPQKRFYADQSNKEQLELLVEYETGEIENISFPIGTLIRKSCGNEYILATIDELMEGDLIYYVQSEERESIENYLLRTLLSEDEFSIEEILEPRTSLGIFYNVLNSVDFTQEAQIQMKKIDWLNFEQKTILFEILSQLLIIRSDPDERLFKMIQNSIWNEVEPKKLIEIFEKGNKKVTKAKLFELIEEMGFKSYKESSFKALCSSSINDQKHYSFHEDKNLLALGKLLGHQQIIDNYQTINEKGTMIAIFLRQIGRSLKRVAGGNCEPFNEIDIAIGDRLKKGVVRQIMQN
ncbi:hypothetical protein [uncultured Methanolobus sp.]|uniref:hypothetical protein n=1 Tax=uncultured Methanolobus sp. TaxID=218300 RepID=UPI0029C977A1|nr:hypothetical protein [uncultured Methanolobus sp.]